MKELWIAIRNRIDAHFGITNLGPEYIPKLVEGYFLATGKDEVITTYHRVRAILVGRKLLKRERSDKGLPRGAYRLTPPGKATADAIALQDRATAVSGGETA